MDEVKSTWATIDGKLVATYPPDSDQVMRMLTFLNHGHSAVPGLVVMRLKVTDNLAKHFSENITLIDANHDIIQFSGPSLVGSSCTLHLVLQGSGDSVLKQAAYYAGNYAFSYPPFPRQFSSWKGRS